MLSLTVKLWDANRILFGTRIGRNESLSVQRANGRILFACHELFVSNSHSTDQIMCMFYDTTIHYAILFVEEHTKPRYQVMGCIRAPNRILFNVRIDESCSHVTVELFGLNSHSTRSIWTVRSKLI